MSDQQVRAAGTEAQQLLLNKQANIFLFDLKNEASEHGFKPSESWTLQLATEAELAAIKKTYYPVVSIRLQPHALLSVYQQVKIRLQQPLTPADEELTVNELTSNEKYYLAAYPARVIR